MGCTLLILLPFWLHITICIYKALIGTLYSSLSILISIVMAVAYGVIVGSGPFSLMISMFWK